MKFERLEFLRVNLDEIGRPGFDLLVIPEVDDNGNPANGCYLSRRGFEAMQYLFGLPESLEDAADIALANLSYFFPDAEYEDKFFGQASPVCVDLAEVERLAREWEMTTEELMEQLHEATPAELAEFGTYDS